MRITGSALALAIAILVATAPSALAATVTNESEGETPCGAIGVSAHVVSQSGEQCPFHMISTEAVDIEVFGAPTSRCDHEYEANIGYGGAGFLHGQTLTGAGCSIQVCQEAGGSTLRPWPIQLSSTLLGLSLTIAFCFLKSDQGEMTCSVTAVFSAVGHASTLVYGEDPELNCAGTGGLIQIHGRWLIELDAGEDEIEFAW